MLDSRLRKINYLRLSITRVCQLRCVYCSHFFAEEHNVLSVEDIGTLVSSAADLGINKVRITGGEPLLRPDLEEIIERISSISKVTDIPVTTNALGLEKRIEHLRLAGMTRLNISIDSLNREKYLQITGFDGLESVKKAIALALEMAIPLKINVVVMPGINDDEADSFITFAKENPLDVRFLQLMPFSGKESANADRTFFENIIADRPWLTYVGNDGGGVADLYAADGFRGRVGLIRPLSKSFCQYCNRIRITSDGKLRPCLGGEHEVDLMPFMKDSQRLREEIFSAVYSKPSAHCFNGGFVSSRGMRDIGG